MLTNTSFHCRGNTERLMDAHEVVVHMKQRDHSDVVIELLTEGVRQPSETPHVHSHIEVLAFHIAGADVLMVRGADDIHALGAKTLRRAVTGLSLGIVAVNLDQLRVIYSRSERIRNGCQVHLVAR